MIYFPFERPFASETTEERLARAFDYLEKTDFSSMEDGLYSVEGDDIYSMVQSFHVRTPIDVEFETHRKYIDIQYVLDGELNIKIAKREELVPVTDYDRGNDVVFYQRTDKCTDLKILPGHAAVFYPEDAHRMVSFPEDGQELYIRKCVVKVLVSE